MIDEPLVRDPRQEVQPAPHPVIPPKAGALTTEWKAGLGAVLVAVVSMLSTPDDGLRARALDYVFWLAIAYLASRTAVKVAHELAARK